MLCAAQEGMRVCVGQRLAVNEAKITLAHIFRRWAHPCMLALLARPPLFCLEGFT